MNHENHFRFSLELLKLLHLDSSEFYKRVVNKDRYDVFVFIWIDHCYSTEKNIAQSLSYILQERHALFLYGATLSEEDRKKLTTPDVSLKQYELISYALSRLQPKAVTAIAS